jgi:hypothetical protein
MTEPRRIRHASIYIDGKKFATVTSNTYSIASGDESQIADDGYIGHSDGAETTKLSADTIEVVSGEAEDSKKLKKALRSKRYLDMSIGLIAGDIEEVRMRCVSCEFVSESAAGKQTGKFEFEGGRAESVG